MKAPRIELKPVLVCNWRRPINRSRQFNLELAAKGECGLLQKLKRHGRFILGKQAVERCAIGFHAAGEFGARNLAAFHFALNSPGDDALERAGFALREQTVLLEEVVEIR